MYTYKCGLMNWSGYGSYAIIGYNVDGDYQNHLFSGLSSASDIACASAVDSSWYNVWYMLGTSEDYTQHMRSQCIFRVGEDKALIGDVAEIASGLQPCPCTLGQAQVDVRFISYTSSSTAICYVQLLATRSSVQSCCYSLE